MKENTIGCILAGNFHPKQKKRPMSRPKNFLSCIGNVYRGDALDKILWGYYQGVRELDKDTSDTKIIQRFIEKFNIQDEWDVNWALQSLNRMNSYFRANNAKL